MNLVCLPIRATNLCCNLFVSHLFYCHSSHLILWNALWLIHFASKFASKLFKIPFCVAIFCVVYTVCSITFMCLFAAHFLVSIMAFHFVCLWDRLWVVVMRYCVLCHSKIITRFQRIQKFNGRKRAVLINTHSLHIQSGKIFYICIQLSHWLALVRTLIIRHGNNIRLQGITLRLCCAQTV